MKTIWIFVLVAIGFASCQKKATNNNSLNGVWESIGSGWVLHIEDSTHYTFYDITSISCLPSRQADLSEIQSSLSLTNDTLSLLKGVMTYQFTRAEELPELCTEIPSEVERINPLFNFDVFAQTVKEHYAFMKLNNINWQALAQQQRAKLSEESSAAELYTVLEETLELLKDNHAYLEATDEVYEALEQLTSKEETKSDEDLPEYGDFQVANAVAKNHFKEDLTKDSWLMKWGTLQDSIGYIIVKAMWLYADLEIPEEEIEAKGFVDAYVDTFHSMDEGDYIEKEVVGVSRILDSVMNDLKNTKQIVIDQRFNGGGQDAVSFEILRRFNTERRQVVKTRLKVGDGYSPMQTLYLEAHPNAYTNPVYVLTSQQTGSAAEAFSICSMAIPNVKRIGAHTQGALSTALEKALPNGWVFSISNEIYMDTQANSYEKIGVPVDYELQYPSDRQTFFRSVMDDLEGDKQGILKAMEALQEQE